MAKTQCNLCGNRCIWCNWGKCKWCKFREEEAVLSNQIISEYSIDFSISWLREFYIRTVKDAKAKSYTNEDIYNIVQWFEPSSITILESPAIAQQDSTLLCEYPVGSLWAWDTCRLCGIARFYGRWKQCKHKLDLLNQ